MNSITDLLDLEDANISISSIDIEGQTKTIYLETAPEAHFCPCCGFRMHSRGTKNRKINHPILQDNYKLVLILKQRRWRCTNPDCLYDISDSFKFLTWRAYLEVYDEILRQQGDLCFKTDNQRFFEWSLQEICQFGWLIQNISLDLHNSDFEGNVMTEYEEKFSAEGYRIYRLEARRRLPEFLKK